MPALLAFKTFSTHQSHLSIPPFEWHGFCLSLSLFFYLKNRTSQLYPAVISQQGNHQCRHRCCFSFSSNRYTFTLTALMCSRLCPALPCEHHDSCCKQTRIDSLQIPTYLPFIIGNSSNLMLLQLFLEQSLQITNA